MPFNAEQLAYAGRHSIDFYLRNNPIDQVNIERPLVKRLMNEKREYGGGLQYVVEQLRYQNDSNFQSYFGDQTVTYNRKRTIQQAKYEWGSFHDGFGLNEDELAQNGITLTDDRNAVPTDAEKVQLTNLFEENNETLRLGFQENLDIMLHRDGTQSTTDIAGIDALIGVDPSSGTVGGLAASNSWWQNYADIGIDTSSIDLVERMEIAWRRCIRVGGMAPNFILAGSDFVDAYRTAAKTGDSSITRQVTVGDRNGVRQGQSLDPSVGSGAETGLFFKGVPITWDPEFEELDTLDSPSSAWEKRLYMINTRNLKLRPIKGHWMVSRKPPRVYDRYVHYWALTAKAALTTNKRNSHAVLSIA